MESPNAATSSAETPCASMNDYEILRMVGMPIAMENGRSAIKQIARKVIGPNIEHSVQKELRRMLEELSAR